MSIFDCRFKGVALILLVDVGFAGDGFADGENLIFVWRLGAPARLRAIFVDSMGSEGDSLLEL